MNKTKFSIRIDTDLLELCEDYIEKDQSLNRTEFIENAIRFYIGFLTSGNIENYMLQSFSSVLTATIRDTENRIARTEFKLAVEIAKLSHVIAYGFKIDEETMKKLQAKCVEEVKKLNGSFTFEDAYRYQNRDI